MSEERIIIEQKLTAEVWWISTLAFHTLPQPNWTSGIGGRWSAVETQESGSFGEPYDPWNEPVNASLWVVFIEGDETTTNIRIETPPKLEQVWVDWLDKINRFATYANQQHRGLQKITAHDVIDQYYFLKRIGRKITLKQLAEQYGFSENYLYQAKGTYDKTGAWGRNLRQAYKVSKKP